jgi:hypothetical protein
MNYLIKSSAFLIVLMVAVTSCKKDDNSSPNSASTLNLTIQQGNWKITNYNDNGNDETNHYAGYSFKFNSDGSITATNNGNTVSGTWSTGTDDSTVKLILSFSTTPFSELNDDWHVLEQSSTIIKLEDVSGGNGGTDYLTFERM